MTVTTYDELKAYAEEHFPEDFAKSPPPAPTNYADYYGPQWHDETHDLTPLREPFSWLRNAESYIQEKIRVFIKLCDMAAARVLVPEGWSTTELDLFKKACSDIAMMVNKSESSGSETEIDVKNTAAGGKIASVELLLEDRFKRLTADFETFKAGSSNTHDKCVAEKEEAETKTRDLEGKLGDVQEEAARKLNEAMGQVDVSKLKIAVLKKEADEWKSKYEKLRSQMRRVMDGGNEA
ncbi:hypothetical protein E8E11_010560 [Didymella keratinophila]|nr:hypothetical protein E8E11_010560 [Didymella keratinophila]